jgi:hypothetical protein
MEYDNSSKSLSLLVWRKVKILEGADYRDQWERVICPTIELKYVTIRCNLNNNVQNTYKSKCIEVRMFYFSIILIMTFKCFILGTGDPNRMAINPDFLGEGVKIVQGGVTINKSLTSLPDMYKVTLG